MKSNNRNTVEKVLNVNKNFVYPKKCAKIIKTHKQQIALYI